MIKKINKSEEFLEKLRKEGKTTLLDGPEHIEAIEKNNEFLEEMRRDFLRKQAASWQSAKNVWLR